MASGSPADPKAALRARVLAARAGPRGAPDLLPWLEERPEWGSARWVAGFVAIRGEIPVAAALDAARARGARVVLPRVAAEGLRFLVAEADTPLVRSRFGVPEPPEDAPEVAVEAIELWLVPGVAFDPTGARLGYGKGFYDRVLGRRRGPALGVAWAEQVVERVPTDPWDQPVDAVLTDRGWVRR